MIHTTRPAYIDDDGNQVPALTVEVPDTLWLQVANEDGEPAAPLDWTHAHGDRIYESDVPYVPRARAEAARAQTAELNDLIHAVSLELAIVGNWARRLLLVIDGNPHGKDTLSYLADRLRKHVGASSNGLEDIRNRWWDELTAANARAAALAAENESLRARLTAAETDLADFVTEAVEQNCGVPNSHGIRIFSHSFMATYEGWIEFLVQRGEMRRLDEDRELYVFVAELPPSEEAPAP